jgi:hypothetical protein
MVVCGIKSELRFRFVACFDPMDVDAQISVRVVCRVLTVALWCGDEVDVQSGCIFLYVYGNSRVHVKWYMGLNA